MSGSDRLQTPIAVVGVSALFPGSSDSRGFWSDILAGKDLVTDVPPTHWLIEDYYDPDPTALDKTYSKRGAFLSPVPFDPMEFGVPPSIVPATDTSQLLALIVAQRVLEDASQGQFATMDRERISVLLGVTSGQELLGSMVSRLQKPVWLKALRESGIPESEAQAVCERIAKSYVPWQESSFPGLLGNVVAGRIANRFDLRGTNAVTDAACASSLAAVSMGINELQLGQSDLVITGGVDAMNDIFMYMCFSKTPALSPTGDCRPFSDSADGTLLGEGIAMLALKRLADAERDGDRVYAVIKGVGSASDGRAKSVYAPLPEGQARSLRRAYQTAGYGPETVELVEAHGTGTKAGDAAEFEGLKIAFGESQRSDPQWCALGTVKSQIGHTKAAAGAAGLFKAVMALHHKVLPPTIKVDRPNPKLEIEKSPFYLNTQRRPWIRDDSHPRRASVSSFGFGGSNFHLALEEFVPTQKAKPAFRLRTTPTELVLLSDPSPTALVGKCASLLNDSSVLSAVARQSQVSFQPTATARLALVVSSIDDLREKLAQAAATIGKAPGAGYSTPTGVHYAHGAANPGKLGFVFPGQGSQYVGMGAEVAIAFDVARAAWDAAASVSFAGERLHDIVFPRPAFTDADREAQAKKLTATEWAQPALGVHSQALANVLHSVGLRPDCVAGHSFGEVSALHEAGVLDASSCLTVARKRGELMRDASAIAGAMTAVDAPLAEVSGLLSNLGAEVVVANHNAPSQVVLSGATAEIAKAEAALTAKGLTVRRLPVATAFHSPLIAGSSAPLLALLKDLAMASPKVDVYGTADASTYPTTVKQIRERLAAQLALPVRFVDQIEAMYARGVRTFIEVGAGSVLTDLIGRILGDREHRAINLDRKGRHGLTSFQEALGRLSVQGVAMDLEVLWADFAPASEKPVKKPAMAMPISGTNYGSPYPPPGGAKSLPPPNPARPVEGERPRQNLAPQSQTPAPTLAAQTRAAPVEAHLSSVSTQLHEARLVPASASATGSATLARRDSTPRPPAPAADPHVQVAWLQAFQEAQRHTADAHAAYQRSMADSHLAFLTLAENSLAGLGELMSRNVATSTAAEGSAWAVAVPPPQMFAAARASEERAAPAPVAASRFVPPVLAVAAPAAVAVSTAPAQLPTLRPTMATAVPPSLVASVDLEELLMTIVAEKTGYPKEMLGSQMELEADLGIDSIKRVEILSAMRERAPGLAEVKPTELAALRTLGQIVERMKAGGGTLAALVHVPEPRGEAASAPAIDLEALLMTIVAEKTGYPREMLGSQMELEADLGIDSIKRVEILSAMRERAPGLREVKPTELAVLRTLGQIVDSMRAPTPSGSSSALPATPVSNNGSSAGALTAPAESVAAPVVRLALREVAAPAMGMALPGVWGGKRVVVTNEGDGLATHVVNQLALRGVRATAEDAVPADADVVIFLGGMRTVTTLDQAIQVNREAFRATRAAAARMSTSGGVLILVQDTGGDFGLRGASGFRPWLGGVSALARTAALEWPKARVKAIDCERGSRDLEAVAVALVAELFTGGTTLEVGLHADGRRTTLTAEKATVTRAEVPSIDAQSVVVASGGARGVTAAALIALAQAKQPRFVLLGRTAIDPEPENLKGIVEETGLKQAFLQSAKEEGRKVTPAQISLQVSRVLANREIRSTLRALEAAGSAVRYLTVDVQNAAAISAALDSVRREWGPITALVHGAGVLADKRIEEKTDEQFDRVFDTKVGGLRALLAATANDPLKSICLFSSIAARTGNPGQSDYAMANEVLNLVAASERSRRKNPCEVHAIGWGAWDGGMVTPGLKAHFRQLGVTLIPLDVGARMFVDEVLSRGSDPVVVIAGANGGGPLGASTTPQVTLEVKVDQRSHTHLGDHRVSGNAVLPVALALEWFIRAACACRPDLSFVAVKNLKVLRGVRLEGFDKPEGDLLVVNCVQRSNGVGAQLAVELRGRNDALHYSATVEMAERPIGQPPALAPPTIERWSAPAIYDGDVLFHGPRFQVIRSIDGISREGLVGTLTGTGPLGWASEPWRSDVAAVDGSLQLALLWSRQVLGSATLPMAVGEYRSHRSGLIEGPIRCVVHGRKVLDVRSTCDVALFDRHGTVVAELLGVETVMRPAEKSPADAPQRLHEARAGRLGSEAAES